jgi:hypothetical protein
LADVQPTHLLGQLPTELRIQKLIGGGSASRRCN